MVNRNYLVCDSCGTKVITRTQIGWGDRQVHAFPCPTCGIGITYVLNLDQKAISFEYEDPPTNAHWSPTEDGAEHVVAFNAELVIPKDAVSISIGITPFIAAFGLFEDWEVFNREEAGRRHYLSKVAPVQARLRVHLERGNGQFFVADAKKIGEDVDPFSPRDQLKVLYKCAVFQRTFLAVPKPGWASRIQQRFRFAETKSRKTGFYRQLLDEYRSSGRSLDLWRQINGVQARLVETAPYLSPALQPRRYWVDKAADLREFVVCNKGFDQLKVLYIECFETLGRLSALAAGLECIIQHGGLQMPTKHATMSVWDFERLPTANKPSHLAKFPVGDMFAPYLDTGLRNGIGHNSAHYDAATDEVVWTTHSSAANQMLYTIFADKVVEICSVLMHAQEYCYGLWFENDAVVGF